jgi:hypothetical protein
MACGADNGNIDPSPRHIFGKFSDNISQRSFFDVAAEHMPAVVINLFQNAIGYFHQRDLQIKRRAGGEVLLVLRPYGIRI